MKIDEDEERYVNLRYWTNGENKDKALDRKVSHD